MNKVGIPGVVKRLCAICNREFESVQRQAKYCSGECQQAGAGRPGAPVAYLTCPECGAEFTARHRNAKKFCTLECARRKQGREQRGENHPTYKGRVQTGRGYIRVWKPGHPLASADGYVLEHRLVLYGAGIQVLPTDKVHHMNHNKADNRVENLMVLPDHAAHKAEHFPVGAPVVNQFGAFKVLTEDEKQVKKKERMAEWRASHQQDIADYKQRRKSEGYNRRKAAEKLA